MSSPSNRPLLIQVPSWVDALVSSYPRPLHDEAEQMRLAIALARANVEHSGGPFGALVMAGPSVLAAGVNCVLSSGFSIAHAEVIALMRGQQQLGLSAGQPRGPYTLVSSAEPCCQCFGALIWSGVERLIYGASTSDVEAIGFDEGPKPQDWRSALHRRGIAVVEELCRDEAREPLTLYAQGGGTIYGLRHPTLV